MGRGTRSTEFLKLCLSDALVKLIAEKPFDSITVEEISREAGVSKATYHRNFRSKDELLSFKVDMMLKEWFEAHNTTLSAINGFRFLLDFHYSNKDFFIPVYKDEKAAKIMGALDNQFFPQLFSENNNYQDIFYIGGVISILGKWFKCGFRETPDEMMEIFYSLKSEYKKIIDHTYLSAAVDRETGKMNLVLITDKENLPPR